MDTVHITLDIQPYMVAIQVKLSDPEKWATLVIHSGGCTVLCHLSGVLVS